MSTKGGGGVKNAPNSVYVVSTHYTAANLGRSIRANSSNTIKFWFEFYNPRSGLTQKPYPKTSMVILTTQSLKRPTSFLKRSSAFFAPSCTLVTTSEAAFIILPKITQKLY